MRLVSSRGTLFIPFLSERSLDLAACSRLLGYFLPRLPAGRTVARRLTSTSTPACCRDAFSPFERPL